MKIEGKPIFVVYDPESLPIYYLQKLRDMTKKVGYPDLFLICYLGRPEMDKERYKQMGYDMVMYQRLDKELSPMLKQMGIIGKVIKHTKRRVNGLLKNMPPYAKDYSQIYHQLITSKEYDDDVVPILIPQWDHSPRSGRNGIIFYNSTPEYFMKHAEEAFKAVSDKPEAKQILFLKSWNEWGEGNYMEPDMSHGRGYIEALRQAKSLAEKK